MSILDSKYDEIKKIYDDRRTNHSKQQLARKAEVETKVKGFKELEDRVIDISMEYGRTKIKYKNDPELTGSLSKKYHEEIMDIRMKKKKLLLDAGYPYDYLELTYDCSKCLDTGYIDSEKCSCYRKIEAEFLYDYSNIRDLLERNNFETMSSEFYTGDELTVFKNAVMTCKNYINNFNSDFRNLLFIGEVGVGKTFLSSCVAKELIDKGASVIFFSATQLFQTISNVLYDKETLSDFMNTLYTVDLLIIDDLGTEMTNDFVRSYLLSIISERALRRKSMIYTSNKTLEDIREKYSDRVFSRMYDDCEIIQLECKDIRAQKRFALAD